jgi:hypothetical protein
MATMVKQTGTITESRAKAGTAALATPLVAAAYAAGIVYMWGEAAFRIAFTNFPDFNAAYQLWNGRVGDIAAMWLTISVVSLALFFGLGYLLFKGRSHVGTIRLWTIALVVSVIVAPFIGEIGQSIGI